MSAGTGLNTLEPSDVFVNENPIPQPLVAETPEGFLKTHTSEFRNEPWP